MSSTCTIVLSTYIMKLHKKLTGIRYTINVFYFNYLDQL